MKVLIADDDRSFQILLKGILTQWGYDIVAVGDGEQAAQQLLSSAGPRLAILDWMMPRLTGPEICERVRNSGRADYVYMILLTGKNQMEDLLTGLEAGADDYISKPVRFNELKLRLRCGHRVLEAQQQQRSFAQRASDGVLIIGADDRIQFANHAARAVFGCPKSDMEGSSFSDFIPGFRQRLKETPERSDTAEDFLTWSPLELIAKKRNGPEFIAEVSFSEFLDHNDKQVLTAVIRDVTERRQQERQRAQAQRLESIGQLAAGIAHEINTPIQYIGDNAAFLDSAFGDLFNLLGSPNPEVKSDHCDDPAEELRYLRGEIPKAIEQISEGVGQVARIVRAMKDFSHPGPLDKVPVDINHAIESTILVSKNEWKYVAEVSTDLDPELPPLPCVAGEINQVILNLIVNAAHAISEVRRDDGAKGSIRISTHHSDDCVEILVSDTGCGIPRAIQSKVFDPFFTTKPVGKGTGQGLSIAHALIVQKYHGEIRFESEPGRGTTFVIHLPLEHQLQTV